MWDITVLCKIIGACNINRNEHPEKQANELDRRHGEENNTLIKSLRHSPGVKNKV